MLNTFIYYICATMCIYITIYAYYVFSVHSIYVHVSDTYTYVNCSSTSLTVASTKKISFLFCSFWLNESLIFSL